MAQLSQTHHSEHNYRQADGELVTPEDLTGAPKFIRRLQAWLDNERLIIPGKEGAVNHKPLRPVGRGLAPTATGASMVVTVGAGIALFVEDDDSLFDPGDPKPTVIQHLLETVINFTVDAADPTNPRFDILSAKVEQPGTAGTDSQSETRIFKDQSTGSLTSQSTNKRERSRLTVTYTPGTPAASPAEPAAPAGETIFARIDVPAAAGTIAQSNIIDKRMLAGHKEWLIPLGDFWNAVGAAWARQPPGHLQPGAGNQIFYLPVMPPIGYGEEPRLRLREIIIGAQLATGGNRRVRLKRWTGASPPTIDTIADRAGNELDLSAQLGGAGFAHHSLTIPTAHGACWSGGRRYPSGGGGTERLLLEVRSDAALDIVSSVWARFWGE